MSWVSEVSVVTWLPLSVVLFFCTLCTEGFGSLSDLLCSSFPSWSSCPSGVWSPGVGHLLTPDNDVDGEVSQVRPVRPIPWTGGAKVPTTTTQVFLTLAKRERLPSGQIWLLGVDRLVKLTTLSQATLTPSTHWETTSTSLSGLSYGPLGPTRVYCTCPTTVSPTFCFSCVVF